jgi:hypothetical protein
MLKAMINAPNEKPRKAYDLIPTTPRYSGARKSEGIPNFVAKDSVVKAKRITQKISKK